MIRDSSAATLIGYGKFSFSFVTESYTVNDSPVLLKDFGTFESAPLYEQSSQNTLAQPHFENTECNSTGNTNLINSVELGGATCLIAVNDSGNTYRDKTIPINPSLPNNEFLIKENYSKENHTIVDRTKPSCLSTINLKTYINELQSLQKRLIRKRFSSRLKESKAVKKHRRNLIVKSLEYDELQKLKHSQKKMTLKYTGSSLSYPMILDGKFSGKLDKRCLSCVYYMKTHGKRILKNTDKTGNLKLRNCNCQYLAIRRSTLRKQVNQPSACKILKPI